VAGGQVTTYRGPFGFIQGWNSKASSITLPPNSMTDAQNVNIVYGDLVKRQGSAKINSAAISGTPAIHGLFDWQTNAGQRSLIITAGTKIFKANDLSSTFTDITGSATITSGQNNLHTFASLNNILIICGGTTPDTPLQWTGSGNVASLAGSPPVGNICAVCNNFAFISGVAANPSRIYWSNVIDPNTWPSTNYVEFRASDGDKVTALCDADQSLVIFKRRSIGILWTIPPTSDASVTLGPLTQVIPTMGCPGPLCVDKLDDGRIAFLGTNAHVYIFDGTALQDISDPEPPFGSIQPTLNGVNVSHLQYAVLKFYPTRREIWLSVAEGSSTTNNAIYVYSLEYNCWESKFVGIAANTMAQSIDTRGSPSHPIIMLTGNYSGQVYEQDNGTTNAEDVNGVIDGYGTVSVLMGIGKRDYLPKSLMVPLEANGLTNLEVNYGFNGYTEVSNSTLISQAGTGGTLDSFVLDTSVLGGNQTLYKSDVVSVAGSAVTMQVQFRNRQAGQTFTVHPFFISEEVIT